ncbi:MAG TPA: hypothetical protein VNL39_13280 [Xanthobacteraceae bacterium]|nr:hypothetical protein [Xanthobacteraceae bacterium]
MKAKPPIDPSAPRADLAVQRDMRKMNPQRRRRSGVSGRRTIQSSDSSIVVVATAYEQLKLPSTNDECIEHEYKGHVIRVERQRVGWRAAIYPKGSPFALPGGVYTAEAAGCDAVMEQAKTIIDKKDANERASHAGLAAAEVRCSRFSLLPRESLTRLRYYLRLGWAAVKDIYFSVDQPLRRNSWPARAVVKHRDFTAPDGDASAAVRAQQEIRGSSRQD